MKKNGIWRPFSERSKSDLMMSKICFKRGDYELASYLSQQALEKSIKSYMLKNKPDTRPKDLGHFPLPKIFEFMKGELMKIQRSGKSLVAVQFAIHLIDALLTPLTAMNRDHDHAFKIIVWKSSLGIKTPEKNSSFKKITEKSPLPDKKTLESFIDDANRSPDRHALEAQLRSSVPSELPRIMRDYGELFIRTSVHAEIGRYPEEIDGIMSTELYAKQRHAVKKMIIDVGKACSDIEKMTTHEADSG